MPDHIRYDLLTQQALRGVVRNVLTDAAKKGLPGEHHFYISFDTRPTACASRERLRAQYPEEMTIILQHQFWDLAVTDDGFEVGLSFGGMPERLACRSRRSRVSSTRRCSSACSSRRSRRRSRSGTRRRRQALERSAAAHACGRRAAAPAARHGAVPARQRPTAERLDARKPVSPPAAPRSCGSTASARKVGCAGDASAA